MIVVTDFVCFFKSAILFPFQTSQTITEPSQLQLQNLKKKIRWINVFKIARKEMNKFTLIHLLNRHCWHNRCAFLKIELHAKLGKLSRQTWKIIYADIQRLYTYFIKWNAILFLFFRRQKWTNEIHLYYFFFLTNYLFDCSKSLTFSLLVNPNTPKTIQYFQNNFLKSISINKSVNTAS